MKDILTSVTLTIKIVQLNKEIRELKLKTCYTLQDKYEKSTQEK